MNLLRFIHDYPKLDDATGLMSGEHKDVFISSRKTIEAVTLTIEPLKLVTQSLQVITQLTNYNLNQWTS